VALRVTCKRFGRADLARCLVGIVALALGCPACSTMTTSIEIRAPAERVWAIVADVEHYQDWNPFFSEAHGKVQPGGRLTLKMNPVGQAPKEFSPTVLEVTPGQGFAWRGRLVLPGLFDGTHRLIVERIDCGTARFTQEEAFSGVLVPFVGFEPYIAGWRRMNAALKKRAEKPADPRP
jgi:hypothetical protein